MMAGIGNTLRNVQQRLYLSSNCRHWLPRVSCVPSVHRRTHVRRLCTTKALRKLDIIKSRFPEVQVPNESITEHAFKNASKYGKRSALVDGLSGETYNYDELQEAIYKVASGLVRHGFTGGDTIMFLSGNSIQYIIVFHAVLSIGGIVTFTNPLYAVDDILRQANDSHPSFIYGSTDQVEKAKEVAEKLGNIKKIFGNGGGCVSLTSLLTDDGACHPGKVKIDPREDVALLPYSSGTTGLPKGVMLTHYNEVANVLQAKTPGLALGLESEGAVQIGFLPMYHMFGIWAYFIYGLALGHTIVVLPNFEPEMFLRTLQTYKVSLMFCPPPIILFLNRHQLARQFDLSALKRVAVGAAPLGPKAEEEFRQRCPQATMGQVYGLSETAPIVTGVREEDCGKKSGSIGELVPNTEAKLVDPLTKKVVEVGETGELWCRGPQIMKGYLNKPEFTAECIDKEGWFKTGDVAYSDNDGYLFITDRLKELIKYKGFQVPPAEIEALLCSHPAVADAGVIGVPDEEAGELPRAYVQLKDGAMAKENDLIEFVSEKVVGYKKLRGGLVLIDVLPRTASGKILRRELKKLL